MNQATRTRCLELQEQAAFWAARAQRETAEYVEVSRDWFAPGMREYAIGAQIQARQLADKARAILCD